MVTTDDVGTINIVINERNARGDIPLILIKPRSVESYIIPSDFSSQTWVVGLARSRNLQSLIAHCSVHHVLTSMYAINGI